MNPLDRALETFRDAADLPYKERLEAFLAQLSEADSEAAMMLLKESRGTAAILLHRGSGPALFVGNALSGTPLALGSLGFTVTVVDRCELRLAFALARAEAYLPGSTRIVRAGDDRRLPFSDGAFSVAVQEDGLPGPGTGWGYSTEELRRVARDEVLVAADNRFGYKKATGRRGQFRRSPLRFLKEGFSPPRGERTLEGTRKWVRGPWEASTAYALYPHAHEFSHVVGLDEPKPQLSIGPRERRNALKMWGYRLGAFRWLTPSFAIHARRRSSGSADLGASGDGARRMERVLAELGGLIGEPGATLDILVATRSNNVLALTEGPQRGDGPGNTPESEAGRWAIHIPLQPFKRRMVRAHHDWLQHVANTYPGVRVPSALFAGTVDGLELAVCRRVKGLNGTDVTGDRDRTAAMFDSAADQLERLLEPRDTLVDEAVYAESITRRVDRVLGLVRRAQTARDLRSREHRLREYLIDRPVRFAMYHADLRSKHLQVEPSGEISGILDWGASEGRFLPLVDLLQLVIHQRKQESGATFGNAWKAMCNRREWLPHEAKALDAYAASAGLGPDDVHAYLDAYPLFVAGMAERNWDYSRPDWIARQFEI